MREFSSPSATKIDPSARNATSCETAYVPPFDIGLGNCNREMLGSLLGAAAGGLAGSRIGDGRGQLAATAGGTLLGFLVGGSIGRNMDDVDQNCIGQALEHAGDGQQIAWNNPQTGAQYQPNRAFTQCKNPSMALREADSGSSAIAVSQHSRACVICTLDIVRK